ncbi:MAG: 23S rRNA (uracil(1939)-C(5))-methyltransferase RlmD [bacterium]|nr:23S rRNA (uracil(1939)-C(5))-methyltransferase RlmD [bacterium]
MKRKQVLRIRKNEHYIINIDKLGTRGEGLGYIDGLMLLVKNALPEEKVEVKIIKLYKKYGIAKLIKVIKSSPFRTDPPCIYFNLCGGCQIQNIRYSEQLKIKEAKIKEFLSELKYRILLPVISMKTPYYFRNKAQFAIGSKGGYTITGLYAAHSHHIIDTEQCLTQDKLINKALAAFRSFICETDISIYNEHNHQGLLRHIVIRSAFYEKEISVCIVINDKYMPEKTALIEKLTTIKELKSISININRNKGDAVFGKDTAVLWGRSRIRESIMGIIYEISPGSFFQVNSLQTQVLASLVMKYSNLSGKEVVWDLYCGTGFFSLLLAKNAAKIYGIDIMEEAVNDAKNNAEINDIKNVDFISGKVEDIVIDYTENKKTAADIVILDPPRKGCDLTLLEAIVKMSPDRIIYVSCNPVSLAGDLKYLTQNKFYIDSIQPVDMFPHTVHVETVCCLKNMA